MRVSTRLSSYPTSCGSGFYGEVEDYTINVVSNISAKTYYSYQSGSWNEKTTWTTDPSGTTLVGSAVPSDNDNVVVLSNRTVTLPSSIATDRLNVTINDGGFIDLSTFKFTAGLNSLSGQGTLRIGSAYFPTVGANSFVQAGGGTTEFYNSANFTLPSQDTYNNLSINAPSVTATQLTDITLNGNLKVKAGTFRINDDVSTRKLSLLVSGDVAVDAGASIAVGNGVTNGSIGGSGGTAPFLSYYENFHRVVINGSFTNNGSVRFTNLAYPIYNAFPPTTRGATSGAASVYFMGGSNATLTCNGTTDFYNLILDKNDQSTSLAVNASQSKFFRLFGANNQPFEAGADDANPNIRKALWLRTGSLVLKGSTSISSLSEGTSANSDYFVPGNGALVLDGPEVVVLTTADDYGEVNALYGVSGGTGAINGVTTNARNSLGILGKVQVNQGYLSTRESAGITYWRYGSGQLIVDGGTVDAKQITDASGTNSGLFTYTQEGGTVLLRGRFQHRLAYSSTADLTSTTLNTSRNSSIVDSYSGTFSINTNTASGFTMTGGVMKVYDACYYDDAPAFEVGCPSANINVTGGTLELLPTSGTNGNDAANFLVSTTAPLGNLTINRSSSNTNVKLKTNVYLLKHLNLVKGTLNADSKDVYVGGDFLISKGTDYATGTNRTVFNGTGKQTFKVDLDFPLNLYRLKVDKRSASDELVFAGSQKNVAVDDSLVISTGKLGDNGNIINARGGVFNSGTHYGTGKIVMCGAAAQTIDGNGNGVFENVELKNTASESAPIALTANATINGALTFSNNKLFDIGSYNLALSATASVIGANAQRYIQTSGQAGDGGVTIAYTSTKLSSTFHVGAKGAASTGHSGLSNYTPATIGFSSAPATLGTITVTPVGYEHPSTTTKNQSLSYFWKVKSDGFPKTVSGVTHRFTYSDDDVQGTGNYVPAMYDRPTYAWKVGGTSSVSSNTISDWTSPTISSTFLDGDYTAGYGAFGKPRKFYSRINGLGKGAGLWSDYTTWSFDGHDGKVNPEWAVPSANDIVIIGGQDSVYLANNTLRTDDRNPWYRYFELNEAPVSCASLKIEKGAVLDIQNNPRSDFGIVLSHENGNGNFRVTTKNDYDFDGTGNFVFPSGDFSDYNANGGTTEFYTVNPQSGNICIMPSNANTYGNVILSPLGGSNIIFPNISQVTILGDLITRGQNWESWLAMTWDRDYGRVVPKRVFVKGSMYLQGGTFIYMGNGGTDQSITIDGDVVVYPGAGIDVFRGSYANTMSIGGSLINNSTTKDLNRNGNAGSNVRFYVSNSQKCDVTFFGNSNAQITNTGTTLNTGGSPNTIFGKVTVNKGSSQATKLTCNIGGTLTTPTNDWLTLQNGSFRYERSGDLSITTTSPFTIPSTAELYVNSPSRILLAQSRTSDNTVYLNGKLTLAETNSGTVYVGNTSNTGVHNDIEYSSGGASEIEVKGGELVVNGQIRRNPSNAAGILRYTQAGGDVTIMGNKASSSNASLEVLNDGSCFNMSGSSRLFIKQGGGTSFGDLYLRPSSSVVDGGEIIFGNTSSQSYKMDASVPLYNLTINGDRSDAKVNLMVNPLVLKGDLLLSNSRSALKTNDIDVTINGNLTNNGSPTCYDYGKNTTTFNGVAQSILGSSVTNFNNLVVNPLTSLTVTKTFDVDGNLTISSGTLICGANQIYLDGDLLNNAKYSDSNGGVILQGSKRQLVSGTGTFGTLTLDNSLGARLGNSITLDNNLKMVQGILDINKYLLSLSTGSRIEPIGTSFSSVKMIVSDGVFSNIGIRKFFDKGNTSFTYPLGSGGKYTPATLTISNNASVGWVRLNNINEHHPSVLDANNALKYFWEVENFGISNFGGRLELTYNDSDVNGPEDQYIAAKISVPGSKWTKAAPGPSTDNVNEAINLIEFTFPSGSSNISGEYTAGLEDAFPDNVETYTSVKNGSWADVDTWSPKAPNGGPNGAIVIINHEVTASANYTFSYRTAINGTLKIDPTSFGHNLGTVTGSGTLYLQNGLIPAGRFDSFFDCAGNATLEYGGSGTYTIIADLYSGIPNLVVSGTGTRIFPNKDLTVCRKLDINGPILDNSIYNKKLTIKGEMLLGSTGEFHSGSGSGAVVSFEGAAPQTLSSSTKPFTGVSKFNSFEIKNAGGLVLNGPVEIGGNLFLTNGKISTSEKNSLTISNSSISCITPAAGSANSYINGPLTKKLDQGDGEFVFPVGASEMGYKVSVRATQGGTAMWTAQYYPSTKNFTSVNDPIQAVNSDEYWDIKAPSGCSGFVKLGWNPSSGLTPLMSVNGISDMRVAEYGSNSKWNELPSNASGDSYNGAVETSSRFAFVGVPHSFTTASVASILPKAKLSPSGAICGGAGIPVSFSDNGLKISPPYVLEYLFNSTPKSVTISSGELPDYKLPTPTAGTYKLVSFRFNNGTKNGVVDSKTIVTSYDMPTKSNAGPDQSLCGAKEATLNANQPSIGVGQWSITLGDGGTVTDPKKFNSTITGVNGASYIAKWTIDNGGCKSEDDVQINFTLKPVAPTMTSPQKFCAGAVLGDVVATVTAGTTLVWYDDKGKSLPSTTVLADGKTYYAEADNGCTSDGKTSVVTNITPNVEAPSISIVSGVDPKCQIANATTTTGYSASAKNSTGYSWSVDNADAGSISITSGLMQWKDGFSGTVNVKVVASGCGPSTSALRTVTVNALPKPEFKTFAPVCAGQTLKLELTEAYSKYLWSVAASSFTLSPDNTATPVLTIPSNDKLFPVGSLLKVVYPNVKVVVTDANGCENSVTSGDTEAVAKIKVYRIPRTGPPYHIGNNISK